MASASANVVPQFWEGEPSCPRQSRRYLGLRRRFFLSPEVSLEVSLANFQKILQRKIANTSWYFGGAGTMLNELAHGSPARCSLKAHLAPILAEGRKPRSVTVPLNAPMPLELRQFQGRFRGQIVVWCGPSVIVSQATIALK